MAPGLTRRQLLQLGLAAGVATGLPGRARAQNTRRPRYYLLFLVNGGMDAVYSTDPRTRAEVESWVNVPYAPGAIVEHDGVPLGPHLAPLVGQSALPLAVLNGVGVRTANHGTGIDQFVRLKTHVASTMPTILELIGGLRTGQPMGCMDDAWVHASCDGEPGLFSWVDKQSPAELRAVAGALRIQARAMRDGGTEAAASAASLEQSAALFQRVADVPPFHAEPRPFFKNQPTRTIFERILWVLEHDLTATFYLNVTPRLGAQPWDTHSFNDRYQAMHSAMFFSELAHFLGELGRRSNRFGPLAENTAIVLGSEIGRFPRLNSAEGKDHFPEVPFLFFGRAFNTQGRACARYGQTGRSMEAMPVSARTGRGGGPDPRELVLDDVGTTLLHVAGVSDPSVYGYRGRVLDFLVS